MRIENERLILRNFKESDAKDLNEHLHEPEVNCFACMKITDVEAAVDGAKERAEDGMYLSLETKMNCTIRNAAISDYDSVMSIMKQVQELHIEWRPDIYKEIHPIMPYDAFEKAVSEENFYVAECEGKVVGVMQIEFKHIENPTHVTRDIVFIDTMAVDKDYRGKGIGHMLFDVVKTVKKQKGYDGIELQVNAKNLDAFEMYKKCGFTEKSINMELLGEQ